MRCLALYLVCPPLPHHHTPQQCRKSLRYSLLGCNLVLISAMVAAQTPVAGPQVAQTDTEPSTSKIYEQALQALARGDLDQAEQQLQQVIRTNPDWAGAWLDLALLALRQKRYAQSEELALILEEKFSPLSAGIQQALATLREQLTLQLKLQSTHETDQAPKADQATTTRALALTVGYDSNANAGLHQNDITLTLPTGEATLQVDRASRAQGAAYTRAAWVQQSSHDLWGAGLIWQWQLQARQNQGLSAYDSVELVPQATLVQRSIPGDISLAWQAVWLHGKQVYQTPLLRWQHQEKWQKCELQNAAQAEQRQYTQMPHMNSQWLGYRLGLQCQEGPGLQKIYVQLAHENAATTARPGGNTQHRGWGFLQDWRNIGQQDQHNLQLKIDGLQSRDSGTYNSLLDHGNPRAVRRVDWQLIWSAPVTNNPQWRWSMGMMQNIQKSNISIFNQKNKAIETSIFRRW